VRDEVLPPRTDLATPFAVSRSEVDVCRPVGAMNEEFDKVGCGGRVEGSPVDWSAAGAGLVACGIGDHVRLVK
jgi:hypothetical protein